MCRKANWVVDNTVSVQYLVFLLDPSGRGKQQSIIALSLRVRIFLRLELETRPSTLENSPEAIMSKSFMKSCPVPVASMSKANRAAYQGLDLLNQGKYEVAAKFLQLAIQLDPKNECTYHALGVALKSMNRLPEALASFDKACSIDPEAEVVHDAYKQKGVVLISLERPAEAFTCFVAAIRKDLTDADAFSRAGSALQSLGRHSEAVEYYTACIELEPDKPFPYVNRGISYATIKQYEQAVASFRKAAEIDPTDSEVYHNQGQAFRDWGKLEDALAAFTKATELNRGWPNPHMDKAITLALLGRTEECLNFYNKIYRRFPEFVKQYIAMVYSGERLQPVVDGKETWQKAVETNPRNRDAYLQLGLHNVYLNKHKAAKEYYTKAMALKPK
eukprot:gb/GECG01000533.1/.p1 GENE.gb/GECG01000533.1/~~gb/GECG01000533.1/.p1  ORF type:complete len:389 (+),score=40.74 gb/GECG01000533.1/:1-1167(+)